MLMRTLISRVCFVNPALKDGVFSLFDKIEESKEVFIKDIKGNNCKYLPILPLLKIAFVNKDWRDPLQDVIKRRYEELLAPSRE